MPPDLKPAPAARDRTGPGHSPCRCNLRATAKGRRMLTVAQGRTAGHPAAGLLDVLHLLAHLLDQHLQFDRRLGQETLSSSTISPPTKAGRPR